jgi:hypothetical protein
LQADNYNRIKMGRLSKKIGAFFLLLSGIILVAHLIVPHDHHLSDSNASADWSLPCSKSSNDHHHGFPIHCHAFNDLASEKATTFVHTGSLHCTCCLTSSIAQKVDSYFIKHTVLFSDSDNLPEEAEYLQLSLLRAPPYMLT